MERLDKLISAMGLASRREVKLLVRRGEICVEGRVCRDAGEKYEEGLSAVFCGREIILKSRFYYMMNKPAGYLSATQDRGDKTVVDLLPPQLKAQGLFPAGRLDRDSHGLLILTNDGDFAHRIMSPRHRVDKLYYVRYEGVLNKNAPGLFADGLTIDGGECCRPARLEPCAQGEAYVTVQEGKYHQVKRMIQAVGGRVNYLKRLAIGPVTLDTGLEEGCTRELTEAELKALDCAENL